MRTRLPILLLTVCATGVIAGSAQAATVTAENGALVVRDAVGERNVVNIGPSTEKPGLIRVDDTAGTQYDPAICEPEFGEGFTSLACAPQPGGVVVAAGDGDDVVNSGALGGQPITINAGPGNDVVRGDAFAEQAETIFGDAGDDKLEGGPGADVIDGGAGNDPMIHGQGGADVLRGGDGDDTLRGDKHNDPVAGDVIDGGPGFDQIDGDWTVESGQHQPHITVSEDGQANDGRPGEGDNVVNLEKIYLNAPATLSGDGEADDYTVFNTAETPSSLSGGGGNDKLSAFDYDDTVDGGAGDDTLTGGYGNDTITGGPGRDTIYADVSSTTCSYIQCRLPQGNDTIDARDGEADQIDCGVGTDTVSMDAVDTAGPNCETVVKGGPGPGPGPGAGLTGKARKVSLRRALARGFTVDVDAPGPGKVRIVAKSGKRKVATGKATARAAGRVAVKVRFTKRGRKALRRARKAKLTLAVTLKPAQGQALSGRLTATLTR
jgi:Ca2+-binding RTX toxin-like protein